MSNLGLKGSTQRTRYRTKNHDGDLVNEVITNAGPTWPVLPWVVGPVLVLLGLLCHVATDRWWLLALYAASTVAGGLALGRVAWQYGEARKPFQRWHAAVSPPLFVLLAVFPMTFGWVPELGPVLGILWVTLSGAWVVRTSPSVYGDGSDLHVHPASGLGDLLDLPGVQVGPAKKVNGTTTRVKLTARGVQGFTDIAATTGKLRNLFRAHHVRVKPVDGDPRSAEVTVVRGDPLKKAVAWPGSGDPGRSIGDPLTIGVRSDGALERLTLHGEHGAARVLVAGCSGSGKTRALWVILAECAARRDAVWWVADVAKGGQTLGPARPMVERTAETAEEVDLMLSDVVLVQEYRSTVLGGMGLQQWEPDCGLPVLIVWIEEAAAVTSATKFGERVTRLSERVRSCGIVLVLSLQRPSGKNMPTDARAQFTTSLVFGLDDPQAPKMVLSPATIAAGAAPDEIADSLPGVHWQEGVGIPRGDWAERCRTYLIDGPTLGAAVAAGAPYRARLDDGSRQAYGGRVVSVVPDAVTDDAPGVAEPETRMSRDEQDRLLRGLLAGGDVESARKEWLSVTGMTRPSFGRAMERVGWRRDPESRVWVCPGA